MRPLPRVAVGLHSCAESIDPDNYRPLVGDALIDEILELSRELRGTRVCHINATAAGGGVAELLAREIPIYRALGLETDWRLIHGDKEFFAITKGLHNGLQGAPFPLLPSVSEEYLRHNQESARFLGDHYDLYIVHDPQPAALRHFAAPNRARWVWRCHIDSSAPDPEVWQFLRPYVDEYDAAVFTMDIFRPADLGVPRVMFIPPAIDPLATKNMELPPDLCRRAVADMGVNLREPFVLQVSRFDPWKDPLGVIRAYRLAKETRPGLQLVLVGAMAGDDPEAWEILGTIEAEALHDPDMHVFTNLTGVGNMEVNIFQRTADLVLQKSIREGFGLVVSEAFWKRKPVVAGQAGGIPMQFPDGYDRYLVDSVEECADRIGFLLDHPDVAVDFGQAGAEHVRQAFLMPRLIRDELRLMHTLLEIG